MDNKINDIVLWTIKCLIAAVIFAVAFYTVCQLTGTRYAFLKEGEGSSDFNTYVLDTRTGRIWTRNLDWGCVCDLGTNDNPNDAETAVAKFWAKRKQNNQTKTQDP